MLVRDKKCRCPPGVYTASEKHLRATANSVTCCPCQRGRGKAVDRDVQRTRSVESENLAASSGCALYPHEQVLSHPLTISATNARKGKLWTKRFLGLWSLVEISESLNQKVEIHSHTRNITKFLPPALDKRKWSLKRSLTQSISIIFQIYTHLINMQTSHLLLT